MGDKFYKVSKAYPQGDNADQHGNRWQTIYLEGSDPAVQILTKNEIRTGESIYGHVEKLEKKSKPGEFYFRFRKEQIPEDVEIPAEHRRTPSKSTPHQQDKDDGMAWGNALNNATALVIAFKGDDIYRAVDQIVEIAQVLYSARDAKVQDVTEKTAPKREEVVLYDLDDEPIDISEIPF